MNRYFSLFSSCLLLIAISQVSAQNVPLTSKDLTPVQVKMSITKIQGSSAVRVVKDSTVKLFDQPTFVKLNNIDFRNGTIQLKVLSRLLKDAPDYARGFIGIAFRIDDRNSKFESIYIRPTNSHADDQVRRNHTVQYFSYPDFPFQRLREESPEQYETHADVGLDQWTTLRIEVKGNVAKLFINQGKFPSFLVNDLKLGPDAAGGIGLWVDIGTEGFFKDVQILPTK
ncbi:MAG: hypothetical protein EOO92_22940 [Pedobacter sp.]|nr:MAG: hypothetical protein EOO92_22940 [Pedobacter sp.]